MVQNSKLVKTSTLDKQIFKFHSPMFYFQVVLSLGKGPAMTTANGEQKELPDYLPEDEENVSPSNMVRENEININKFAYFIRN